MGGGTGGRGGQEMRGWLEGGVRGKGRKAMSKRAGERTSHLKDEMREQRPRAPELLVGTR